MNKTEMKCFDTLHEAYTDDTMSQDERYDFEQSIENDTATRAKFELQAQVNESLIGMFGQHEAPASVMGAVRVAAAQQNETAGRHLSFFLHRRWAMAALLFISACVAWEVHLIQSYAVPPSAQIIRQPSMMESYIHTTGIPFREEWTHTNGQDLAETFRWRQGSVLRLSKLPANTHLLRKRHMGGISKFTTAVLFEVDSQDVIVFVDRVEEDHAGFIAEQIDGLNIFRRYLGELVLYEVTPHEMPQAIGRFYEAGI